MGQVKFKFKLKIIMKDFLKNNLHQITVFQALFKDPKV